MRFLKTNTATRVTVGPFLDETDAVTPQTGLTVTNEKLTLVVDDGGVPTLVLDTAPTASGGNNDMVHITGDDAGWYDLELTAANLNYVGRAVLSLTDAANHLPVWHEFIILPAVVYDSLVGGSDLLDVSVTQFAGSAITSAAGIPEVKVQSIASAAVQTILTTVMTEAYASDNAEATVAQILYMIWSAMAQARVVGQTITAYGLDGSTARMTFTTDDPDQPTERFRTT